MSGALRAVTPTLVFAAGRSPAAMSVPSRLAAATPRQLAFIVRAPPATMMSMSAVTQRYPEILQTILLPI